VKSEECAVWRSGSHSGIYCPHRHGFLFPGINTHAFPLDEGQFLLQCFLSGNDANRRRFPIMVGLLPGQAGMASRI